MELTLEQHIIHHLLLRSSIEKDVSLYKGKMGLILFFSHYFRHTNKQVYDDTAGDLMIELQEEINTNLPVGFALGLSGIGWGIEYLIQNGFANEDSLEICKDIDKKIMGTDLLRITDYSLDYGLEGIIHYVLAHIKGVYNQHSILPFDEMYLNDLYEKVTTISKDVKLTETLKRLSSDYVAFYEHRTALDYSLQLSFLEDIEVKKEHLNGTPLGLKKGLSGFLLKNLINS
jgi:Lanthionine synthetase C-like protein.